MAPVDLWSLYKSVYARTRRAKSEATLEKAEIMAEAAKAIIEDPNLQRVTRFAIEEYKWINAPDVSTNAQRLAPRFEAAIMSGNFVINRPLNVTTSGLGASAKEGVIYCAHTGSKQGQIKIGVTAKMVLADRLDALEKKYGYSKVTAPYWVRVTEPYKVENRAQEILRNCRVSGLTKGDSTEWYATEEQTAISAIETAIAELGTKVLERMDDGGGVAKDRAETANEAAKEMDEQEIVKLRMEWEKALLREKQNAMDDEARRTRMKHLINLGKECGYVLLSEIVAHLPVDLADTKQIESIATSLSDMGIQVHSEQPEDGTSTDALYELGRSHEDAIDVPENDERATTFYRRAAERNHAQAQFRLGCCYEWGRGVEEDEVQAVNWYRKAAEQGHADAQYELGRCCLPVYLTGSGSRHFVMEGERSPG